MTKLWLPFLLTLIGCGAIALPRYGLWARWVQARRLTARFQQEDVLKHILKYEAAGGRPTLDSIAGALEVRTSQAAILLQQLEERALVTFEEGRLRLKAAGREMALHIVRAHRLWESYLAEQTGVAEREWHQRAERHEHLLTPSETDALAAKLGHPTHDPHGDVIPASQGELAAEKGLPLHAIPESTPVVITHIEDEPGTIYAQLCAEGLRAGMRAFIIEKTPHRIRFWADGNEHILAPVLANNISAVVSPEYKLEDLAEEQFLSQLRPGQSGKVLGLTSACRGVERRRLLDLGFVAGTQVRVEMVSPAGDPTAYLVRGTVVALRREQANLIRVESALSA
jgi:DtxR family Mn-dependent transcriptional regulator